MNTLFNRHIVATKVSNSKRRACKVERLSNRRAHLDARLPNCLLATLCLITASQLPACRPLLDYGSPTVCLPPPFRFPSVVSPCSTPPSMPVLLCSITKDESKNGQHCNLAASQVGKMDNFSTWPSCGIHIDNGEVFFSFVFPGESRNEKPLIISSACSDSTNAG